MTIVCPAVTDHEIGAEEIRDERRTCIDIVRTLIISFLVYFEFSEEKDEQLRENRGISFIDVIEAIEQHGVLLDFEHPNQQRYPGQRVYVVQLGRYAYCVPYVFSGENLFLKTAFPSRKFKHLIEEEDER